MPGGGAVQIRIPYTFPQGSLEISILNRECQESESKAMMSIDLVPVVLTAVFEPVERDTVYNRIEKVEA
jgi:hypothetical protein